MTPKQFSVTFIPAVRACYAAIEDLDMVWEAHNPVQGEATPKVLAYRVTTAVIDALEAAGMLGEEPE